MRGVLGQWIIYQRLIPIYNKKMGCFFKCMEIKGYIWVEDCGRKSSTSDKGLCNE